MRQPKDIIIQGKTLKQILIDHEHWTNKDCDGWENMRANLRGAGLRGADLSYAGLRDANLRYAGLSDANLRGADLCDADLRGADLSYADLRGADLSYAGLRDANLSYADLRGADLYNAKGNLIDYRKGKILTEEIIGYKKCRNNVIVTLKIPRGATVFSINGNKCRTNKAKVIVIDGADRAYSTHKYMTYYVGDEFSIYDFNCEYNVECGEGIHFFTTREEAENY